MITASFARSARSRSFLRCGLQGCGSLSKGEHAMRSNLHDIAQEVQAGRTVVTTVKPVLVKIEARAHPCGIQLRLYLLDEQGGTIRLEHVVPRDAQRDGSKQTVK